MRAGIGIMMVGCVLAACSNEAEKISFDGQFYRTDLDQLDARHEFRVTASPVSRSLLGAKEAARYEATVFCVNEYGSSAIKWVVGPDDPDEAMPISNDTLTLQGACPQ
ncbi:hypothetical protein ROLI_012360 [Roseobacter fucihabitans]|uniref:Lipoprotein n=1 Tax=Roseobacter fucihabitans TaxID=1537242 RepID=A0ABZ2BRW2_9RHOB|nr:hypothetical protein [Roseobacter litoralis]MBC6964236.1 hypothetical protein [Roseobacter litoralis]